MRPRYTVVWLQSAENQLAEAWLHSADREQLRADADLLESNLGQMPSNIGEELEPGERLVQVGSLVAFFTVSEDDRRVTVQRVKDRTG